MTISSISIHFPARTYTAAVTLQYQYCETEFGQLGAKVA